MSALSSCWSPANHTGKISDWYFNFARFLIEPFSFFSIKCSCDVLMRFSANEKICYWPLTNQRLQTDKIILRVLKHMAAWKLIPLLIFFGNFVWENVIFLCNYNCSGLKQPGSGDKSQFNIRDQPRLQWHTFQLETFPGNCDFADGCKNCGR